MQRKIKNNNGFTLVELSIVLVIIGLIVGGVLVGRDLIEVARIQKIISEVDKIRTSMRAFEGKYNAVPGDMRDATVRLPGTTSNGNGSGRIRLNSELYLAWQHLSLAGMYPGEYTGAPIGQPFGATVGLNIPESEIDGNGYAIWTNENQWQTLLIITGAAVPGQMPYYPTFTPFAAYSLDAKIDDGLPNLGLWRITDGQFHPIVGTDENYDGTTITVGGFPCNCTQGISASNPPCPTDPNAEYALSYEQVRCTIATSLD